MFIPLAFINRFHQFHGHHINRVNHFNGGNNYNSYNLGDNLFCDVIFIFAIIVCVIMIIYFIKEIIYDCKHNL